MKNRNLPPHPPGRTRPAKDMLRVEHADGRVTFHRHREPVGPDSVANLSPDQARYLRTCVHEAAHAVVAAVFGAKIDRAAVSWSKVTGVQGATTFRHGPTTLGRDQVVTLAGPYAEARWLAGGAVPRTDAVLSVLRAAGTDARSDLGCFRATATDPRDVLPDTAAIVGTAWSAIIDAARAILNEGEIDHRAVLAALGIAADADPATTEFALSLIRQGEEPGSFRISAAAV